MKCLIAIAMLFLTLPALAQKHISLNATATSTTRASASPKPVSLNATTSAPRRALQPTHEQQQNLTIAYQSLVISVQQTQLAQAKLKEMQADAETKRNSVMTLIAQIRQQNKWSPDVQWSPDRGFYYQGGGSK